MLPDEAIMCHETGFEKRCFDMVTKCKCRKWVRVQGRDLNDKPVDLYDCADHWGPQMRQQSTAQLSQQLTTIAKSIDYLRAEVGHSQDASIVGALDKLNTNIRQLPGMIPDAQKLLGGG